MKNDIKSEDTIYKKPSYPFELIQNTNELVILKNTVKTNLDVATHPYIDKTIDYITISKGDDNVITLVKTDGSSFCYTNGKSGYTIVNESLHELRRAAFSYIHSLGITTEIRTTMQPCSATIYYNNWYNAWQAHLYFPNFSKNKQENYFSSTAKSENDMLSEIKAIFNTTFLELKKGKAATGIDIWNTEATEVKDLYFFKDEEKSNEIEEEIEM